MKNVIAILLDEDRVAIAGPIFVELIQGARDLGEKLNMNNCMKGLH